MFKMKHSIAIYALLAGALLLSACNMPAAATTPTVDANTILTQAAGTVAVELTQSAALTPSPSATIQPTNTQAPTATTAAQPTTAPAATNTTAPASNNPAPSQDAASFVADVTIPDGTGAAPGVVFDKTWRIKNTGVTTWTSAYSLVYVDGDKMSGPDSVAIPNEVRPGETVDITVRLTAPQKAGSYQTFYRLRNASGQYFRLDGSGDLWIKIVVGGSSPTPDLTATANATPQPSATPTQ
jgi:hypothetical protein